MNFTVCEKFGADFTIYCQKLARCAHFRVGKSTEGILLIKTRLQEEFING